MAYDLCMLDEATGKSLPVITVDESGKHYHYDNLAKITSINTATTGRMFTSSVINTDEPIFQNVETITVQAFYNAFNYSTLTLPNGMSFPKLRSIVRSCLGHLCANSKSDSTINGVYFPKLEATDVYGLASAFDSVRGLTGAVMFDSLRSVDTQGLFHSFYLTKVDSIYFPLLETIDTNGCLSCFHATNISTASFPMLRSIGASGMNSCFFNCRSLTSVFFPALTTANKDAFGTATANLCFSGCTALKEIHFASSARSVIQGLTGYSSKFGASSATIYFDL